ncbi:putative pollen-specific leucine-rich repeat extensin-like protein 3 [Iris pallida]|uniref:Pollen-specific leucine-rich repeat extensin-like protein 3 n=1 Tax=Iris pallida TaxID=29817 RepID=A0AAX6I339_IRIPA|nr:putative pollen-specific leucine-rich repeat extensin-like protein 3 [Iris pallida]KAJ6847509.1 putative pollen-specific leucine-rich repeat extensin-like protein 3 [Iris pallida]
MPTADNDSRSGRWRGRSWSDGLGEALMTVGMQALSRGERFAWRRPPSRAWEMFWPAWAAVRGCQNAAVIGLGQDRFDFDDDHMVQGGGDCAQLRKKGRSTAARSRGDATDQGKAMVGVILIESGLAEGGLPTKAAQRRCNHRGARSRTKSGTFVQSGGVRPKAGLCDAVGAAPARLW